VEAAPELFVRPYSIAEVLGKLRLSETGGVIRQTVGDDRFGG
jgi:hypothetical protein